jgi:hypothetical protein
MEDMIFGIGKNVEDDEWDDEEEDDFNSSAFVVYISDKKTWEEKHCCNDKVNRLVFEMLDNAGFAEMQEAIFEPLDGSLTKQQIFTKVSNLGIIHNEDFELFMSDSFL